MNNQLKEEALWKMAKARVAFRWSFAAYFIVNAMLVVIWFFTSGFGSYFWPIWPMMGWGMGIAFQYFHAFHGDTYLSTLKEYERMKENGSRGREAENRS